MKHDWHESVPRLEWEFARTCAPPTLLAELANFPRTDSLARPYENHGKTITKTYSPPRLEPIPSPTTDHPTSCFPQP
jgi:hypothetical protein